jgi:hypothetical protein
MDAPNNSILFSVQQATLASYYIAWWIAKLKKPHTIEEDLVKLAAVDIVCITCGDEDAQKLQQIPLSYDAVCAHINDMSEDIKKQVIAPIKASGAFRIQLHESTHCQCLH